MNKKKIEIIDGAAAIARGALDAGCDFFAGYPITPHQESSDICLENCQR